MQRFLLGHFTVEQRRFVSLPGIHQAAVIIVRVGFDASDVELPGAPIVTKLNTQQIN